MNNEQWVKSIATACYRLRGVKTDEDRIKALVQYLNTQPKYDELSRKTAESWILYGDWSYRKADQLTLNDFYPSSEQLARGLNNKDLIVMSRQEFNLKIQKAKSSGMYSTTNVAYEPLPTPPLKNPNRFTLDMLNKRQE